METDAGKVAKGMVVRNCRQGTMKVLSRCQAHSWNHIAVQRLDHTCCWVASPAAVSVALISGYQDVFGLTVVSIMTPGNGRI